MKSLTHILKESYETYQLDVVLKNYKRINKSDIINKIRAAPYVIRIKIVDDPRLHDLNKGRDYELTILRMKFLNVFDHPIKGVKSIKQTVEYGRQDFHKINGVISLKPLVQTLRKTQY